MGMIDPTLVHFFMPSESVANLYEYITLNRDYLSISSTTWESGGVYMLQFAGADIQHSIETSAVSQLDAIRQFKNRLLQSAHQLLGAACELEEIQKRLEEVGAPNG